MDRRKGKRDIRKSCECQCGGWVGQIGRRFLWLFWSEHYTETIARLSGRVSGREAQTRLEIVERNKVTSKATVMNDDGSNVQQQKKNRNNMYTINNKQ